MEGEQTAQGKPNRSGETQSLSVLGDASGEDGEKQNTQARAVCSPRRREKSVPEKILCGATRGKAVDCTHGKPSGGFDEHDPNAYEGASFQEAYDKAVEPFMQLVKEGEARGWITTAPRKPVQSAHKPKIVAQGRTHNGLYMYTCSAGHRWTSTAPESGGCTRCEQAKPEQIAQKKLRLTHIPRHDAVGFALCERDGELVTLNRRNRARLSEEATCAKCQRVRREAKKEDERQAREAEQWATENPEDAQTAQE